MTTFDVVKPRTVFKDACVTSMAIGTWASIHRTVRLTTKRLTCLRNPGFAASFVGDNEGVVPCRQKEVLLDAPVLARKWLGCNGRGIVERRHVGFLPPDATRS